METGMGCALSIHIIKMKKSHRSAMACTDAESGSSRAGEHNQVREHTGMSICMHISRVHVAPPTHHKHMCTTSSSCAFVVAVLYLCCIFAVLYLCIYIFACALLLFCIPVSLKKKDPVSVSVSLHLCIPVSLYIPTLSEHAHLLDLALE